MKHAEFLLSSNNKNNSEFKPIQISDAILRASKNRNWTEYTRMNDQTYAMLFLKWVDQKGLKYWHELDYEKILEYKKDLIEKKYAFDTIRLYLLPIRRTAKWLATQWSNHYIDFCNNLRISRNEIYQPKYDDQEGNSHLSLHEVLSFLDWLLRPIDGKDQKIRNQLALGVSLQGLVGLQMQEAIRLTNEKFDSNANTIIIDGEVKNRYRIRKIPVPNLVGSILKSMQSIDPDERFIYSYSTFLEYSKAVKREMILWDQSKCIKTKDLRNTLQTEAIDGDWFGFYLQRYVGHSPKTIGERNYYGDLNRRMVDLYRERVVPKIDILISKWNAPIDSPLHSFYKWEKK